MVQCSSQPLYSCQTQYIKILRCVFTDPKGGSCICFLHLDQQNKKLNYDVLDFYMLVQISVNSMSSLYEFPNPFTSFQESCNFLNVNLCYVYKLLVKFNHCLLRLRAISHFLKSFNSVITIQLQNCQRAEVQLLPFQKHF